MAKTIVGVRKSVKDGKTSYNVYYTEPFEDWEATNGSEVSGLKCGNEWTNRVDCGFLKPGDQVDFSYQKGFQGMAVLSDVKVIKAASK